MCSSEIWVRLQFENGVLASIETVPMDRNTLANVHYVSSAIDDLFQRVTGESFKNLGVPRSDWFGTFGKYRGRERWKSPWLKAVRAPGGFAIEGDVSGSWSSVARKCLDRDLLEKLGFATEPFAVDELVIGPADELDIPDDVRRARGKMTSGVWAIQRPASEWTFIEGEQLRAMAAGVTILSGKQVAGPPLQTSVANPELRIIASVSARRRRAMLPDGRTMLEEGEDRGSASIATEPEGRPVSTISLPLFTKGCAEIGTQLATWASGRSEGWRVPFGMADIYLAAHGASIEVTGVVPSSSREYASPEALRGDEVLEAGDVFTICAIVAELATAEHPFEGNERGILAQQRRLFWGSAELAMVIDQGLQSEPDRRGTLQQLARSFSRLATPS